MPVRINFDDWIRYDDWARYDSKMENSPSVIESLKWKIKRKYDDSKMFEDTGVLVISDLDCEAFRRGDLKEHQKLKYVHEYFRNLYSKRRFRRETALQLDAINSFFSLGGKELPRKVKLDREFINTCLNNHDTKSLLKYLKKMIFSNEKMQI